MFWARLATEDDLIATKELLKNVKCSQLELSDLIMIGDLDGILVSTASLKINGKVGLMHSLAVREDYRGQYLGDSTARTIIHLADNRKLETIYTYCDNLEFSYFLAKMNYRPCDIAEIEDLFPEALANIEVKLFAFKLNLEEFFSHSCNCSETEK